MVALTGGPEGDTLIRRAARIAARTKGADLLAVHVTRSDGLTGAGPGQPGPPARPRREPGRQLPPGRRRRRPDRAARLRPRRQRHPARARGQPPGPVRPAVLPRGRRHHHRPGPARSTCTWSPTKTPPGAAGPGPGPAAGSPRAAAASGSPPPPPACRCSPCCWPTCAASGPAQRHRAVPGRRRRRRPDRRALPGAGTRRSPARCCSTTTSPRRCMSSRSPSGRTCSPSSSSWRSPSPSASSSTRPPGAPAKRPGPAPRPRRCPRSPAASCAADRPLPALLDRLRETFATELGHPARTPRHRPADPGHPAATRPGGASPPPSATDPCRAPDEGDTEIPVDEDLVLVLRGQPLAAADRRVLEGVRRPGRGRPPPGAPRPNRPPKRSRSPRPTGCAAPCSPPSATTCAPRSPRPPPRSTACAGPTSSATPNSATNCSPPPRVPRPGSRRLVENLLDMSRLQADAVGVTLHPIALDEAVPRALDSTDGAAAVILDVPDDPPGGARRPRPARTRPGQPARQRAAPQPPGTSRRA